MFIVIYLFTGKGLQDGSHEEIRLNSSSEADDSSDNIRPLFTSTPNTSQTDPTGTTTSGRKSRPWNPNFKILPGTSSTKTKETVKDQCPGDGFTRKYRVSGDVPTGANQSSWLSSSASGGARGKQSQTFGRRAPKCISDLLSTDHVQQVDSNLKVQVVYLQEFMPEHPQVLKNRRRMVLADATGYMNAHIFNDKDVSFKQGDTIILKDFKIREKTLQMYENCVPIR